MAKLHSWVFSNSSRCAGVITLSTRSRLCCGVSGDWVIGLILPCTFIAGGMPAVMNRSDAFWCAISLRNEVKSMVLMDGSCAAVVRGGGGGSGRLTITAWTDQESGLAAGERGSMPALLEQALVLGVLPGLLARDQATLDQVLQVLVQGHHAVLLAGLDRRVHLRHLVLADQVAAGAGAADEFRARRTRDGGPLPAGVAGHRAQRCRQHGARHRLLAGAEVAADAVDGVGRRAGVQGTEHQVAGLR